MSNFFRDKTINKKEIQLLVKSAFIEYGVTRTAYLLDKLKEIGFRYATDSGISIGPEDLRVAPAKKNLIQAGNRFVNELEIKYQSGQISKIERFQGVLEVWLEISERLKSQVTAYFKKSDPLNSIYMMSFSGARGNLTQVHQLVGMRGMMANPSGDLIEVPIKNNFREGLTVTDYIISSYGARKGVVDTALRTADAGYLTRRLVDVAQDLVIRDLDCGTKNGLLVGDIFNKGELIVPFRERIIGRTLGTDIKSSNGTILLKEGEIITPSKAQFFISLNIRAIKVRSPLTCQSSRSICSKCYGWNLATNRTVGLGETVGVIAAQSIGEPGTQLTMRTFHTGGVFSGKTRQKIYSKFSGKVCFSPKLKAINSRNSSGKVVWIIQNSSYIKIRGFNNEQVRLKINKGTLLEINHNEFIRRGDPLYELIYNFDENTNQEASYRIFSDINGEVLIRHDYHSSLSIAKTSNILAWILAGQPLSTFRRSKVLVKKDESITKLDYIANINLYNEYAGTVNLYRSGLNRRNIELEIRISPIILDLAPVIITSSQEQENYCVAQTQKKDKKKLILNSFESPILNRRLGEIVNIKYMLPFGGSFSFIRDHEIAISGSKSIIDTLTTILHISQQTYSVNLDQKSVYISSSTFLKEKVQLWKNGPYTRMHGLCEIKIKQKKVKEIFIKPGISYKLKKSKLLGKYHRLNKYILYPGELLWNSIKIEELTYVEIYKRKKSTYILLRPITCFNIPKKQSEVRDFSNFRPSANSLIFLRTKITYPYIKKKFVKSSDPICIKRTFLLLKTDTKGINQTKVKTSLIRRIEAGETHRFFEIHFSEKLSLDSLTGPNIKEQEITLSTFFLNNQYLEPYTNFASINILSNVAGKIRKIKDHLYQNKRQLLMVSDNDICRINTQAAEKKDVFIKENNFVAIGTEISPGLKSHIGGFVIKSNENTIDIHKGKVYLFSSGAFVYPSNHAFIRKGELLGLLKYKRARTNDIIQGLPKVEAILEARMSRKVISSNSQSGLIYNIRKEGKKYKVGLRGIVDEIIEMDQEPIVKVGQFINAGAKLTAQPFNAHFLLENYFDYFRQYSNIESATYRSFAKVQLSLLSNVQDVYRSQGVSISDKHIEVIIRKMTSKVKVIDGGFTTLLPDDLINFVQLQIVNKSLVQTGLLPVLYRPTLLGISKACLKNESFLAAASFQETRRVLTEAAIEGKIDWLFGIKESIIVGKMIPAGTGFKPYIE